MVDDNRISWAGGDGQPYSTELGLARTVVDMPDVTVSGGEGTIVINDAGRVEFVRVGPGRAILNVAPVSPPVSPPPVSPPAFTYSLKFSDARNAMFVGAGLF